MSDAVLEAIQVRRTFPSRGGAVAALDGVSARVRRGETLALVGESGSGKSTLGRLMLALDVPTSGRVEFHGVDLASVAPAELRSLRRRIQPVFQDPGESLDPRMTIRQSLEEPLRIHGMGGARERTGRVSQILSFTGLPPDVADRLPHALSGGQRQRAGIARALMLEPECLVADEPTSALDVSLQAQIVNLLLDLQERRGTSIVLIAHDLRLVAQMAHWVAVMRQGTVVEEGPTEQVLGAPTHPYTRALLAAVPAR